MLATSLRRLPALVPMAVGLVLVFGIGHSIVSGTGVAKSHPKSSSSKGAGLGLPVSGKWKPVFDDEFNGTSLDLSKWYPGCQWGSATDFTCVNVADQSRTCYRPSQVHVGQGVLTVTIIRHKIACSNGLTYPYTSGFIDTSHVGLPTRFKFRYGYLEARIRMPSSHGGPGYWPGFWSGAASGGWPPEIDVVEWSSPTRRSAGILGPDNSGAFYHWRCGTHVCRAGTAVPIYVNPSAGFHTYGLDWEPDEITWYFDGQAILRYAGHTTGKQMDLRLSLAVKHQQVAPSTRFPASMQVQWVRVWQHKA